ncbi:MAG: alpha/beta fold hydrolase [Actinobacteria bacterium]|nr:alpha/beta fold hydrolase [Actinomycetota bacterium]
MSASDVQYVTVGPIRYAYIEAGEGPLLLLGHSTFSGKEMFASQIEALSPYFRCVAVDWRGHGKTGFDPAGWRAEDVVADVPKLLDALGSESAFMAGVSQGAAVFSRVALAHPERIDALVNMCAGMTAPPENQMAPMRALAETLADATDEAVRRRAVEAYVPEWHSSSFPERRPEAAAAEIELVLSHDPAACRLIPEVPGNYNSIVERLGEISCPTMIVWGLDDPRPKLGAEIAAAIPGAELKEIPAAGHHVNLDAPQETSAAILDFLRRQTPGG